MVFPALILLALISAANFKLIVNACQADIKNIVKANLLLFRWIMACYMSSRALLSCGGMWGLADTSVLSRRYYAFILHILENLLLFRGCLLQSLSAS